MITNRAITANIRKIATLIVFVFIPIMGCNDNPVAPCGDCDWTVDGGRYSEVTERSFTVDGSAVISVDNFAGSVTYRIGEPGTIRVVATRRAGKRSELDRVEVWMETHEGGLDITGANPDNLKNASVDFDITAPSDAIPQIATGVGDIDYRGRPSGACDFRTGVGSIRFRLRSDVNITVNLSAAVGSIFLGIPVDGMHSSHPHIVRGRIGHGGEGSIHASTAVGNIYLIRW